MTAGTVQVSPAWLRLREAADAAARASALVHQVAASLPSGGRALVHDLGCGTGSMGRWLAPRLNGSQHWILSDLDGGLLSRAASSVPGTAADGAPVTLETHQRDVTRLQPADLADASLVTASALLDLVTAEELERLVVACADAGCPALVTISVTGSVELTPADPLDGPIADAFNAHQRRTTGGRRLLGPDAVGAAAAAFSHHGYDVLVRSSPWRLGPAQAALTAEWLVGWVIAACQQRPELAGAAAAYARRRLADARAGRLGVIVHHDDLLALPR